MQRKNSNTARIFFALWPEASVRQALYALTTQYKPQCKGRVIDADALHMTLQFMGEVERTRLPQLIQTAGKVSVPPFGFILDRLSFWPHNRIAYVTLLTFVPALDKLVASLKQELAAANFQLKNDEFVPHVTLLRNVEDVLEPQTIMPIEWWVDSFVLVESTVTDRGPHYQILQKWPLHPVITKC
jgi:2'-5' RNA ligase